MSETSIGQGHKAGAFQIGLLLLTMFLLFAIVADTVLMLPKELANLIHVIDTLACGVFFVDFCVRLHQAESKATFMFKKWGWVDLIACVPNVEALRWGRMVRVLRVIRLLRGIRSVRRVLVLLFEDKLQGGTATLIFAWVLLISFGSASILLCEQQPGANIRTAEDAVWWSVSTVATGGCADKYPVTTEGRVVAMVLMVAGAGMIGGVSGLVASLLLGAHDREGKSVETGDVLNKLSRLEAKVDALARLQGGVGHERP
jgi:voltage-gated potassium channel